jgi:hypothetical protein
MALGRGWVSLLISRRPPHLHSLGSQKIREKGWDSASAGGMYPPGTFWTLSAQTAVAKETQTNERRLQAFPEKTSDRFPPFPSIAIAISGQAGIIHRPSRHLPFSPPSSHCGHVHPFCPEGSPPILSPTSLCPLVHRTLLKIIYIFRTTSAHCLHSFCIRREASGAWSIRLRRITLHFCAP